MNKLSVKLSPLAILKLDLIQLYLIEEWSVASKDNFLKLFKTKVDQVASFPKSCIETEFKPGIYKAIIGKHSSFYYRISEAIEIITVIDNRQDPEHTKEEIIKAFG